MRDHALAIQRLVALEFRCGNLEDGLGIDHRPLQVNQGDTVDLRENLALGDLDPDWHVDPRDDTGLDRGHRELLGGRDGHATRRKRQRQSGHRFR